MSEHRCQVTGETLDLSVVPSCYPEYPYVLRSDVARRLLESRLYPREWLALAAYHGPDETRINELYYDCEGRAKRVRLKAIDPSVAFPTQHEIDACARLAVCVGIARDTRGCRVDREAWWTSRLQATAQARAIAVRAHASSGASYMVIPSMQALYAGCLTHLDAHAVDVEWGVAPACLVGTLVDRLLTADPPTRVADRLLEWIAAHPEADRGLWGTAETIASRLPRGAARDEWCERALELMPVAYYPPGCCMVLPFISRARRLAWIERRVPAAMAESRHAHGSDRYHESLIAFAQEMAAAHPPLDLVRAWLERTDALGQVSFLAGLALLGYDDDVWHESLAPRLPKIDRRSRTALRATLIQALDRCQVTASMREFLGGT